MMKLERFRNTCRKNKSAREGALPPEKQQRLESMKDLQSYHRGEGKHQKRKA
jgi:hypothetical protein